MDAALWDAAEDGDHAEVLRIIVERKKLDKSKFGSVVKFLNASAPLNWKPRLATLRNLLSDKDEQLEKKVSVSFEKMAVLSVAAFHGHEKVLALLLKNGADPNVGIDSELGSPLILATRALTEHVGTVELLVAAHAKGDVADELGRTPLHWCAHNGHAASAQAILQCCGTSTVSTREDWLGRTPLLTAIEAEGSSDDHWLSDHSVALTLLKQSNVATKVKMTRSRYCGWTALHLAVASDNPSPVIAELLRCGSDIESRIESSCDRVLRFRGIESPDIQVGMTALHQAVALGSPKCVRTLLGFGADKSTQVCTGNTFRDKHRAQIEQWTPLELANHYNHATIAAILSSRRTRHRDEDDDDSDSSGSQSGPNWASKRQRMLIL